MARSPAGRCLGALVHRTAMTATRNACLLGFLLTIVPLAQAATDERVTKEFSVGAGGRLVLKVDFGALEVTTNAASAVRVEVYRKVTASTEQKEKDFLAERPIRMEQDGGEVTVESSRTGLGAGFHWGRVRTEATYRIQVPPDCTLDLQTAGGSIQVQDVAAVVRAKTSGGSLKFVRVQGDLVGLTSGGSISLQDCQGDQRVETSGGRIEVTGGGGTLKGGTSGGSIRVARFGGPARVATSGGSISLEAITGEIRAETQGGSVKAVLSDAVLSGPVSLSTSGGSVSLTVPPEAAFALDAVSSGGGVRSELPVDSAEKPKRSSLSGTVNGGGPEVRLRTSGGSILVKKGASSVR